MSLGIDVAEIGRVLLPDGWHDCRKATFSLDSYEYNEYSDDHTKSLVLFQGGQCAPAIPSTGFVFVDEHSGKEILGPLTSILAVEYRDTVR